MRLFISCSILTCAISCGSETTAESPAQAKPAPIASRTERPRLPPASEVSPQKLVEDRTAHLARVFADFDRDASGTLSKQEAGRAERLVRTFDIIDTNRDSLLSPQEIDAFATQVRASMRRPRSR